MTDLGDYLREQRIAARMSLRQLSDLAGISNPYLSQIERGLKRPSAEILQQIAHGLQLSAESLFIRAGLLEEGHGRSPFSGVVEAIAADPYLTPRQRGVLLEVYRAFVDHAVPTERRGDLASAVEPAEVTEPTDAASPVDASEATGVPQPVPTRAPRSHRHHGAEPMPQPN